MKMNAYGIISFLMLVFTMLMSKAEAIDDDVLKKNVADSQIVVSNWLALVDQGQYARSWDVGSFNFKATIKRDEWVKALEKLRRPLGEVRSREVMDIRWAVDPKGLPKGDYMVFVYKTQFTNKANAYELLTLQQAGDGSWHILTYTVN
jgi:hypothetical protein